jgi:hypothetical protein
MFERYTEKARRTIFFARYEASQFGRPYIETEHLLLGLLREDKELANKFLASDSAFEAIRHSIEQRGTAGRKVSTSVDLPLSYECKRALAYGAEEAERSKHKHIGTAHLLLGLLREEKSFAAQLLREQGLTLDVARQLAQESEPPQVQPASIAGLDQWLAERGAPGGAWTVKRNLFANRITHFAIYANDPQPPPRVPLLCIEVIRDDRFVEVQERCDGYIVEGIAQVWLLEPALKRAYTVTKTDGLREFKGEILQIADPPLEMNLRRIFD